MRENSSDWMDCTWGVLFPGVRMSYSVHLLPQQHQPTAPSVAAHRRRQATSTSTSTGQPPTLFAAPSLLPHATKEQHSLEFGSGILNSQQKQIEGTSKHMTINQNKREDSAIYDYLCR
jgi:hypothetical protein